MYNGECRFLFTDRDHFCAFMSLSIQNDQCKLLANKESLGQRIVLVGVECKTVFSGDESEVRVAQSITRKIGSHVVFELAFGQASTVGFPEKNGCSLLNEFSPFKGPSFITASRNNKGIV